MKLLGNNGNWDWSEGSEGKIDKQLCDLQKMYYDKKLSIWGTEGCDRCGSCCYVMGVGAVDKLPYTKCEYLDTLNGCESDCDLQDEKPIDCAISWDCSGEGFGKGTPAQRIYMMRTAVDILKTRTEEDILELLGQ